MPSLKKPKKRRSPKRQRLSARFLMIARWTLGGLLVTGTLLLAHWTHSRVLASEAFALTEVRIEGANHLQPGPLAALIKEAFPSQLPSIDLERVRSLVEAEDWVREATVRRKMPASLVIQVDERQPEAVAAIDSGLLIVDREGIVLDSFGKDYSDLTGPIVRGLRNLARENAVTENRRRMEIYMGVVEALEAAGHGGRISEIDLADPTRLAFIPSDEPVPVIVGDRNHVARYEAFLSQLELYRELKAERGEIEYVDVTYEGKIIFHTPEGGSSRLAAVTPRSE